MKYTLSISAALLLAMSQAQPLLRKTAPTISSNRRSPRKAAPMPCVP